MITHYCDECANFQSGNTEKKLCALQKKLLFKAPKDMIDILLKDWGHYQVDCKSFKKKEE